MSDYPEMRLPFIIQRLVPFPIELAKHWQIPILNYPSGNIQNIFSGIASFSLVPFIASVRKLRHEPCHEEVLGKHKEE
jgi:hypothetical protein